MSQNIAPLALPANTPAGVRDAIQRTFAALRDASREHSLDGQDAMFVLAAITAAFTCGAAEGHPETAAELFSGFSLLGATLIAGTLQAFDNTPAERHDEPEIAALKAARPAGHA